MRQPPIEFSPAFCNLVVLLLAVCFLTLNSVDTLPNITIIGPDPLQMHMKIY